MEKWLEGLNPQQRTAVTYGNGPLLIVAGAGTGKTNTLAYRVSYLLSQKIPPERILLLTFTRRAAEEMLKRATSVNAVEGSLTHQNLGWHFPFHRKPVIEDILQSLQGYRPILRLWTGRTLKII